MRTAQGPHLTLHTGIGSASWEEAECRIIKLLQDGAWEKALRISRNSPSKVPLTRQTHLHAWSLLLECPKVCCLGEEVCADPWEAWLGSEKNPWAFFDIPAMPVAIRLQQTGRSCGRAWSWQHAPVTKLCLFLSHWKDALAC